MVGLHYNAIFNRRDCSRRVSYLFRAEKILIDRRRDELRLGRRGFVVLAFGRGPLVFVPGSVDLVSLSTYSNTITCDPERVVCAKCLNRCILPLATVNERTELKPSKAKP
jgi:hypothetical protein